MRRPLTTTPVLPPRDTGVVAPPERRYPLQQLPDGTWVQPDPLSCPEGEWFDLVGFRRGYGMCGDREHGGHLWWCCDHCGKYVYDPPCDLNGEGFRVG